MNIGLHYRKVTRMTKNDALNKAITLIQAGKKAEAHRLLSPYLDANPQDVVAWLWEARTRPSLESRIKVLETCLLHNPDHPKITPALAALHNQQNQNRPGGYSFQAG